MNNRFGSSSILPQKLKISVPSTLRSLKVTASSSDFSYLLEGGTGFVRALTSIDNKYKMKRYLNFLVRRWKKKNKQV